ncbi:hypothetical protein PTMSG1_09644 [Pyrenophora teres f. maculata]|nr:hypothetical protein PTMSG1_09644 [Pyrenophora teres f. maculata]
MAANFAPYQDIPESSRALSPPPLHSPRPSTDRTRSSIDRTRTTTHDSQTHPYEYHDYFQPTPPSPPQSRSRSRSPSPTAHFLHPRTSISMFNTSLSIPLDYEASAAYLLLPPAGAVLLLILEHQSDYVRFHAWQSSLLFSVVFIVHVILSWSSWLSWGLFVGDVVGAVWLASRAWVDAATLDRYEVPFFGPLASSILDDE